MSLPNENVVNAIIESYLSTRKLHWGLENQDGKVTLPSDTETARKIDICFKILQKANAGRLQSESWIDIIQFLFALELQETAALNQRNILRRYLGSVRLLETLQAVRSYILESLKTNNVYLHHSQQLLDARNNAETIYNNYRSLPDKHKPEQVAEAKVKMDNAYAAYKPYDLEAMAIEKHDHNSYFSKYISKHPDCAKDLTFDDFEKSVISKYLDKSDDNTLYKSKLCKKLLDQKQKQNLDSKAQSAVTKTAAQDLPKAVAPSKSMEIVVSNNPPLVQPAPQAVLPIQPTPVAPKFDFFADFDFSSLNPAPEVKQPVISAPAPQPSKSKPAQAAPIPEPRRANRKQQEEPKSSALRDNSTFKQPAKSSITTRSKSAAKGGDPYDWGDAPGKKTSTKRGY